MPARIAYVGRYATRKKLTITVDEEVYDGLHKTIGPRKISRFVQEIVRPHVVRSNLNEAYAKMAKDKKRERKLRNGPRLTFKDVEHEEVMDFIEKHRLMGKGLCYIDMHLPASAILTGVPLWTLDKKLHEISLNMKPAR